MDLRERAALLRESGEAFARAGDTARALLFHDAAIDLYLQAGDTDTAEALCETVVTPKENRANRMTATQNTGWRIW